MEILIKSDNTPLLEEIVDALRFPNEILGDGVVCYLGDRVCEINEENPDITIINIE